MTERARTSRCLSPQPASRTRDAKTGAAALLGMTRLFECREHKLLPAVGCCGLLPHNRSMNAREAAEKICAELRAAGHQAYLVGGCVRDLLLEREPADY